MSRSRHINPRPYYHGSRWFRKLRHRQTRQKERLAAYFGVELEPTRYRHEEKWNRE